LPIYTDGSYNKSDWKAGAGVSCKLSNHYISIGTGNTAFDGDIKATEIALTSLVHQLN
jgi:hypothetical protein